MKAAHVTVLTLTLVFLGVLPPLAPIRGETSPSIHPHTTNTALGKRLVLIVSNPPPTFASVARDRNRVVLFLDSVPIRGVCTESFQTSNSSSLHLEFNLARNAQNGVGWTALLGSPAQLERQVQLNVGADEIGPLFVPSSQPIATLVIIKRSWFWVASGLFLVFGYLFWMLATRTEMIRDAWGRRADEDAVVYRPEAMHFLPWALLLIAAGAGWYFHRGEVFFSGTVIVLLLWIVLGFVRTAPNLRPYSLARTQMAIWFFLVIGAYVFLWLVTGTIDSPNTTVLVLIGIGTGTALAAEAQDSSKSSHFTALVNERARLEALANRTPDQEQTLSNLIARIKEQTSNNPPKSEHFLNDVLTDDKGISFHRFQMFTWTIVLGFVFVHQVHSKLAMPDFNPSLLALMGISSGTYLGFLITEPRSAPAGLQ